MAVSAATAVVAVKCHCNVAVDHKLDTGGGGGEGHNPRLYPGMGNGAEFGQGHGDDEDDDDKDSGNGSVLEFVPPSEFQVSFTLWWRKKSLALGFVSPAFGFPWQIMRSLSNFLWQLCTDMK